MAREIRIYTTPASPYCRNETSVAELCATGEGAKAALQDHRYLQRLTR